MVHAAGRNGELLDRLLFVNSCSASEPGVGGRDVAEAFLIMLVVVVKAVRLSKRAGTPQLPIYTNTVRL